MRRAFTQGDFLNTRLAHDGEELEYGRTNVPVNMGGECDPVYGFWEHSREAPVLVPDGSIVDFEGFGECVLRWENGQLILEKRVKLIDLSFDPKDWGKTLKVIKAAGGKT
jgi:hypothetical protein